MIICLNLIIFLNNNKIHIMSNFKEIINNYVKKYQKITLNEFIEEIKNKLYPNKNMTFMEYFMELADEDNDGKFIVPHQKLIEYGIVNIEIDNSSKIKQKLETLDLISNKHYLMTNISHQVNNTGTKHFKQYTLTPEAFKLCLLRAKKSNKEGAVDPKVYAEYYMFIEKCILYYNKYEKQLAEAFSKIKDDNIKRLESKIDDLKNINISQNNKIDKQSEEIKQLLTYGKNTTNMLVDVSDQLDETNNKLNKTNIVLEETSSMLEEAKYELDDVYLELKDVKDELVDVRDELGETTNKLVDIKDELVEVKDELVEVNYKLDETSIQLNVITETLDDRNIKTKSMQYFIVIGIPSNKNIIFFYYGCNKHINKVIKDNLESGNVVLIEKTYNPNPLSLKARMKDGFKNHLNILCKQAEDSYNNNKLTYREKTELINILKKNKVINFNRTSIKINNTYIQSIDIILNIIKNENNRRFDVNGQEIK